MKKYYAIILFVFVFQLMTTAVNDGGVFLTEMEHVGGPTIAQVNESGYAQMSVEQQTASEGFIDSLFTGAGLLIEGLKLVAVVFIKSIVIYTTLTAYGLSAAYATVFQGVYTLVMYLALLEFKTGRRTS